MNKAQEIRSTAEEQSGGQQSIRRRELRGDFIHIIGLLSLRAIPDPPDLFPCGPDREIAFSIVVDERNVYRRG